MMRSILLECSRRRCEKRSASLSFCLSFLSLSLSLSLSPITTTTKSIEELGQNSSQLCDKK